MAVPPSNGAWLVLIVLLGIGAWSVRAQRLPTPFLLINDAQITAIEGVGTCPMPGSSSETFSILGDTSTRVCNATSNPPTDASSGTGDARFWKSGNGVVSSSLTVTLVQPFVINFVQLTLASNQPVALRVSGQLANEGFRPFMYIVTEASQCMSIFGVQQQSIVRPDFSNIGEPFCNLFSQVNPSSRQEFQVRLFFEREDFRVTPILNPRQVPQVVSFFSAQQIQLDFTVPNAPTSFVAVQEVQVGAHCLCNGHATSCIELANRTQLCDCMRNTQGAQCEICQPLFNQFQFTPNQGCQECQCFGHASSCTYNAGVEGTSVLTNGTFAGGGVCNMCGDQTTGVNCQLCLPTNFRQSATTPVDASLPCQACNCVVAGQTMASGNCADGLGQCINCKPNVERRDCGACLNNFFNLTAANPLGCEPCNCFVNGTTPGQACDSVNGQCNCKANVMGRTCDTCESRFFNLQLGNAVGCTPCGCDPSGSQSPICDPGDGQCVCGNNIIGRTCGMCRPTTFNFPVCQDCGCNLPGQVDRTNLCGLLGDCTNCKANVVQLGKCDVCQDRFFNLQDSNPMGCTACGCNLLGTVNGNAVCDKTTGQCVCEPNVIGRQCDMCAPATRVFNGDPILGCIPCNCVVNGTVMANANCDVSGNCVCLPGVAQPRCGSCSTMFFNFVADVGCQTCDCHLPGQINTFNGQCEINLPGQCLGCKDNVSPSSRRCDTCRDEFFNLQDLNPVGCDPCNCQRDGTPNRINTCTQAEGRCTCKANVQGLKCDTCMPEFTMLSDSNLVGCQACGCHAQGSVNNVCNNVTGVCTCNTGFTGMLCTQCAPGFFGFPNCQPCNCNIPGIFSGVLTCDVINGQCSCLTTHTSRQCDACNVNHFGNPTSTGADRCTPCNCNTTGTVAAAGNCDQQGRCTCLPGVAQPRCGDCLITHFNYNPTVGCTPCNCHLPGQVDAFNGECNPNSGQCLMCKANVDPNSLRCDTCRDEFFNLQNTNLAGCSPCACNIDGTLVASNVCTKDAVGQCPCKTNVMGIKCDVCRPGFTMLMGSLAVGCQNCLCSIPGSVNNECDVVTGMCTCNPGFTGLKCNQCAPGFFGFPNCMPCACNLPGTVGMSPVCDVTNGQCQCLSTHTGRQCESCAADHFGVPNTFDTMLRCRLCMCNQFGSINNTCNVATGQCPCVPTTQGLTCNMCQPRHFNITFSDDGTNTFGGGCLRCDQCTDDLLARACTQESIVVNATLRINSTEIIGLVNSAATLLGLEDRYRMLRMQANNWTATQQSQLTRLVTLRLINTTSRVTITERLVLLTDLQEVARTLSGVLAVERNRINAIARSIQQVAQVIIDLSNRLAASLSTLRSTRNTTQLASDDAQFVLAIEFTMQQRYVTYALANATRVAGISSMQLSRSESNSNATMDLSRRIDAAVARVNLDIAQRIVDLAALIPPNSFTEDTLAQVMNIYQQALAVRTTSTQATTMAVNANTATEAVLVVVQDTLNMVTTSLQRVQTYYNVLRASFNLQRTDLTSNTVGTVLYAVTQAQASLPTRRTYAMMIEQLYNSTQPHANDAALAIIDYSTARAQVANATSLVSDGEAAVAMAVTAAGNVAETQARAQQAVTDATNLLSAANQLTASASMQSADVSALLTAAGVQSNQATQEYQTAFNTCSARQQAIIQTSAAIGNLVTNVLSAAGCVSGGRMDNMARAANLAPQIDSFTPAVASTEGSVASTNAMLTTLETRRTGMGSEVMNVTSTLAQAVSIAESLNASLDSLMGRLQTLTTQLNTAQSYSTLARNCCLSLTPQMCPNNDNVIRLTSSASYLRYDSGHSGAEPFDLNGDFVDLSFRTRESNGVLMYLANNDQSQFFGLELRNGNTLVMRARRGSGAQASLTLSAANGGIFNDNNYHVMTILLYPTSFHLSVDQSGFSTGLFPTPGMFTIVNAALFIGGTPASMPAMGLLQAGEMSRPSLIGCVRGLIYNQRTIDILRPSFVHLHSVCNCNLDQPMVTTTATTPMPSVTTMTMTQPVTITMPPIGPPPCEQITPAPLGQGVRINGGVAPLAYLRFARTGTDTAPLNFQEGAVVSMIIRTFSRDGVLMYISDVGNNYLVGLEVRNGYISAVARGGVGLVQRASLTSRFVADGAPHAIDLYASPIGGNMGILHLVVDDLNDPANSFTLFPVAGNAFTFAGGSLYLGGAPQVDGLLMTGETSRPSFDGCILLFVQLSVALDLSMPTASMATGPCFATPRNYLRIPDTGYARLTVTPAPGVPLTIQATVGASARATYLFHLGSASTGQVSAFLTADGALTVQVRLANLGATTVVSAVPPTSVIPSLCSASYYQVIITVSASSVSVNVAGTISTVPFSVGGGSFAPDGTLIVGLVPSLVRTRDALPVFNGFVGCVGAITVNGTPQDVSMAARSSAGLGCGDP